MKQLPNLYPLRFFLSVCVIIYHLPLICKTLKIPAFADYAIFKKGELAVYYFFSLSGFLIFRIIFIELKKTNSFDFKQFYIRRIQRLYPVYYLVFAIGLFLYYILLPKIGVGYKSNYSFISLILDYVFLLPNVFKYYHPNVGSIMIILWSIGIEEQFYLFIPVFLFVFKKHIIKSILFLLGLLLLILIILPSFYKFQNYYFYFLAGGLVAILSLKEEIKVFNNKLLQVIIYSLFVLSFFTNLLNFNNFFYYHFFNLIISSLLISIISDYPIFIIKNKFIDYLGKISYGIYMYHMIIITGILFIINKFKPYNYMNEALFIIILNLFVIFLIVLVAHISYQYFEKKFYKRHAIGK